jgi:CTP synthase (UTP-ammonia lyase)
MSEALKIAIIGDYNFTYNSHHATNLSLDHAAEFLELELNYYWIKINEALQFKKQTFDQFDGIWVAPGPYINPFFLSGIFRHLVELQVPVFLTGECFKLFIDHLITANNMNPFGEKLISENLIAGTHFERIEVQPKTLLMEKLYENCSAVELSATRFSMYPQLLEQLVGQFIDIEAVNQFDDPEIISMKTHAFFLATSFCPQISSTRDLPHPLVYTFLKMSGQKAGFDLKLQE